MQRPTKVHWVIWKGRGARQENLEHREQLCRVFPFCGLDLAMAGSLVVGSVPDSLHEQSVAEFFQLNWAILQGITVDIHFDH